jgi:hypothetical protein
MKKDSNTTADSQAIAAIKEDKLFKLQEILKIAPQVVNTIQRNGSYLLHYAAFQTQPHSLAILISLLQSGNKDQLLHEDEKGRNVLDYALLTKSTDILCYLLFKIQVPFSTSNILLLKKNKESILGAIPEEKSELFKSQLDNLLSNINKDEWKRARSARFKLNTSPTSLERLCFLAINKNPSLKKRASETLSAALKEKMNSLPM